LPESCTATPAAGHPDGGAKTVRWTTNAPIPKSGTVVFVLASRSILRG